MKKLVLIVYCLFSFISSYSQQLCMVEKCSIDTLQNGIFKITSNLKPKSIQWIDQYNNIIKTTNSSFYLPYDSIKLIIKYPKRNYVDEPTTKPNIYNVIDDTTFYSINRAPTSSNAAVTIDSFYLYTLNKYRFYNNGNNYYFSKAILYKVDENKKNMSPLSVIGFDNRNKLYSPNSKRAVKSYLDIISEFLVDSKEKIYFANRFQKHFYTYDSKNEVLDSFYYPFLSGFRFFSADTFFNQGHKLSYDMNSNFRLQFKNIDTIIISDSCYLSFVDVKKKTSSLITKLSNEIIHFNVYGNKIYFINNFKLKNKNNLDSTEFYFYELDCITKKLDSNLINLAGKIDSTSFYIDIFKNIYLIQYRTSSPRDRNSSNYWNYYLPFKRYSEILKIDYISKQIEVITKNKEQLKYHITSWDPEINFQMDCNGNIIFQGTIESDTAFFVSPFIDTAHFYNEGFYKINRFIEDTLSYNKCQFLKAKVSFWNGEEKNVEWIPPCTVYNSKHIIVCDSFKFNNKTYYQSGLYTDTAISSIKPDTIYTLNLIINKSKFDTIKAQTCNTFKFGDSTYSKSGTYTHKYNAKNGCDSFRTLILTSKEVTGKIKLENGINYTALTPNASYQWYYCYPWRRITNAQNQTFSTTTKGSYAVIVSSLGCTDTSDCVALYSSGIESLNQNSIQIFPNPIQDNFTIQFGNENKENSVEIYNALGQKIKSFNTKLNEIQVDMKNEAKGIYLLRINQLNIFRISKK